MSLESIISDKLNELIDFTSAGRRTKAPPEIELRSCNSGDYLCCVSYNMAENKAIFYFDTYAFSTMQPITKSNQIKNLIISCTQQIFWNSQANDDNKLFLEYCWKQLSKTKVKV